MSSSSRTLGVDEAGRGPILGPMALAVVALDPAGADACARLGVQDSKRFGAGRKAQEQRAALAAAILEFALEARCVLVTVPTIDAYTARGALNVLEREVADQLLVAVAACPKDQILADGARLFAPLTRRHPSLVAVDHGESAHVAVAAASILAKHARDHAMEVIAARYADEFGPLAGGGYLNAPTRRFLAAYRERYGDLPPEARRSWGAKREPEQAPLFV